MWFVVNRVEARSDQFDMYMQLDVNTEIYPMHVGEKFMMVLATTLNLDGTPDSGFFSPVISTLTLPLKCHKFIGWSRAGRVMGQNGSFCAPLYLCTWK